MKNLTLDKSMEGYSGRIPGNFVLSGQIVIENGIPHFECEPFDYVLHREVRDGVERFWLTCK
jgi:hypothetical protein